MILLDHVVEVNINLDVGIFGNLSKWVCQNPFLNFIYKIFSYDKNKRSTCFYISPQNI